MKKILKIEYDFEFELVASACSWSSYKFAWRFGYELGVEFEKIEPISLFIKKKERNVEFEQFIYKDEETSSFIYVIKNKSQGEFLFKELKNFDYLIQLEGDFDSNDYLKVLNKINEVHLSILVDIDILKNKEILLS